MKLFKYFFKVAILPILLVLSTSGIIGIVISNLFTAGDFADDIKRRHGSLEVFSADLNHNGKIDANERYLTWSQSFDKLLAQTDDFDELRKIYRREGDYQEMEELGEQDESIAIQLIRYEILHQCEELIIQSGAVVPLNTLGSAVKIKEHIEDFYVDIVGMPHFEYMYSNTGKKTINMIYGSAEATVLDHTIASDGNSMYKIATFEAGLKKYKFEYDYKNIGEGKVNNKLEDCLGQILKEKVDGKLNYHVFLGVYEAYKNGQLINKDQLPDVFQHIVQENDETIQADGYTFKKKQGVYWSDGQPIEADNFIWSWNRALDYKVKCPFSTFFYAIDGYKEQRQKKDFKSFDYYKGMKGLEKINNNYFKIKLAKFCSYFDSLLSSSVFLPLPIHTMTKNTGTEDEEIIPDWWSKPETACASGAFKLQKVNNISNGTIELVKNEYFCFKDEISIKNKTEKIIFTLDLSQTSSENKYNNDLVDLNTNFDTTILSLDPAKYPKDLFVFYNAFTSYFMLFNANSFGNFDKFIDQKNKGIDKNHREIIRQKMIKILSLLINRCCLSNFQKLNSKPLIGTVPSNFQEECVPERRNDNKIYAKRDSNGRLVKLYWYQRSISEEEVIIGKNNEKILVFKTNFFEKRNFEKGNSKVKDEDFKNGIFEKAGVKFYFPKDNKFNANINAKVQKDNFEKAKKIAEEIGIKFDDKNEKFIDFPRFDFICESTYMESYLIIKNIFNLFGIDFNLSLLDRNTCYAYLDIGLYETTDMHWSLDYYDSKAWIEIFGSNSDSNYFFIGKIDD